ncbi:MAG: hypothetical protein EPO24_03980 [Bacteroidetes bacterium]|nr:MAG: hypothetical protein EPO24_03980 [Bacteroidota bacterium]
MKPHIQQRNEQLRRDYKKLLIIMNWEEAIQEVAKQYNVTYYTAEAIVFHKGRYGMGKGET